MSDMLVVDGTTVTVDADGTPAVAVVVENQGYVVVVHGGTRGDPGEPGETGPVGPPGGSTVILHPVAEVDWLLEHNLGFYPNITIFDDAGDQIISPIEHVDTNTAIAHHSALVSGRAVLS